MENAEQDGGAAIDVTKSKKTPWSQLNIKTMKVAELRGELDARGIDSKGVKNILIQRLQEVLDKEKTEDENRPESIAEEQTAEQQNAANVQVKEETADEPMETDGTEKQADDLITAEELVEKIDDAIMNEKSEKELKELEKAREKFVRQYFLNLPLLQLKNASDFLPLACKKHSSLKTFWSSFQRVFQNIKFKIGTNKLKSLF
jgi:hypothetical protein